MDIKFIRLLFFYFLFGTYSNKSAIEQSIVWHILARTSVSSRVIVLFMYPFNCERWISAFWQNLFLLSSDFSSKSFKCIFILPLSFIMTPPVLLGVWKVYDVYIIYQKNLFSHLIFQIYFQMLLIIFIIIVYIWFFWWDIFQKVRNGTIQSMADSD